MKKHYYLALAMLFLSSQASVAQEDTQTTTSETQDSLSTELLIKNLPEIMITGERPIAKMERGRVTYDMSLLNKKIPSDNAYESVTHIPGVVESNGNLNFAGREVTLILNGRATTMSAEEVKARLKSIPADQLAKAEVMVSAPARYHVRGTAINVVTKDYLGTHQLTGQLQTAGTISKYLSVFGKGNLLYTNGKFSLDAFYSFNKGKGYKKDETNAVHPLGNERIPYNERTENFSRTLQHDYRLGLEYAFAENHRLSATYTGEWFRANSDNITTGDSKTEHTRYSHTYLNNVDFSYLLPFKLTLGVSYTGYKMPAIQNLQGSIYDETRDLTAHSRQKIDKWMFTADQDHTLTNGWSLNYGLKAQFTKNNNYQTTTDSQGNVLENATTQTNYVERILNGYVGASKQINKALSFDISATLENFHTPRWNEWRIYPTMNLMWNINSNNMLNLSFDSNSEFPNYWSTMSGITYTSAYSEIWGNPDLKPYDAYQVSFMWQFKRKYNFIAFANITPDYSAQLPYQPSDRTAVILKFVNFDYRHVYGLQSTAQFRVGEWLDGNASIMGLYLHDKGTKFFDLAFNRKKLSGQFSANMVIKFIPKVNLRLTLKPFLQTSAIQGVYDIKAVFNMDASLRWTSDNNKWMIGAGWNNIFNGYYDISSTAGNQNYNMKVWQKWPAGVLSVIYNIGSYKEKRTKKVDTSRMGY